MIRLGITYKAELASMHSSKPDNEGPYADLDIGWRLFRQNNIAYRFRLSRLKPGSSKCNCVFLDIDKSFALLSQSKLFNFFFSSKLGDNHKRDQWNPESVVIFHCSCKSWRPFRRTRFIWESEPRESPNYSRTSMARTPLGPWKIVRATGSSSQWRLIMAPGREANIANSGKSNDLIHNNCMLSVLIRIASNIQFHIELRKLP